MKKEDQIKMLLHPENYTDEQFDQMLKEADIPVPDANEEWKRFGAMQCQRQRPLMRWAASIIGILMLSGIAYAAIHIVSHNVSGDMKAPTQQSRGQAPEAETSEPVPMTAADSTAQSRLYDNVRLGVILDELSTYYHIKVVYYTEDARQPRLYYQWKREYTIEKVVEMLNNFEWLQMELKNDTLYVKSTAIPAHDC